VAYWQVEQHLSSGRDRGVVFGNPVVVAEDALLEHRFGIDARKVRGLRPGEHIVVWPSTGPMLRVTRVAAPKKGRRVLTAPQGTSVQVRPTKRGSFNGYEVHLTMADGDKYVSRFVIHRSAADLYATRIRRALANPAGADLTDEKYGLLRLVTRRAKATGSRARRAAGTTYFVVGWYGRMWHRSPKIGPAMGTPGTVRGTFGSKRAAEKYAAFLDSQQPSHGPAVWFKALPYDTATKRFNLKV